MLIPSENYDEPILMNNNKSGCGVTVLRCISHTCAYHISSNKNLPQINTGYQVGEWLVNECIGAWPVLLVYLCCHSRTNLKVVETVKKSASSKFICS